MRTRFSTVLMLVLLAWLLRHDGPTAAQPNTVATNIRVEQMGGGVLHVLYDLVSGDSGASFLVTLEASSDEGVTFGIKPRSVTGDVGVEVPGGAGKRIVWNAGRDVERVQFDRFRFRVIAIPRLREPTTPASAPTIGSLTVMSVPEGSAVAIDGTERGVTPLKINNLAAGPHRVTLRKSGFLENSRVIQVAAGADETMTVDLTPTTTQTVTAPAASGGGSKAKWLIPVLAGAGGVGAVVATRGGQASNSPPAGSSSPPTSPTTSCSFNLTPTNFNLAASPEQTQTVAVATSAGCSWTAASESPFMRVVGSSTSSGNGSVAFTIEVNPTSNDRTGTLRVAGQAVPVTQVGNGPDSLSFVSLTPPNGSTLTAGQLATSQGVLATLRYFLGSRDRAFVCAAAVTVPGTPRGQCAVQQVTRGSGTVGVRFIVQDIEPNLPVTTTRLHALIYENSNLTGALLFSGLDSATYTWLKPATSFFRLR